MGSLAPFQLSCLTFLLYPDGMFGPKLKTIFASRWKAAWFSASVLLTAYCSVPDPADTPSTGSTATHAQESTSSNPWALKPGEKPSHIIR